MKQQRESMRSFLKEIGKSAEQVQRKKKKKITVIYGIDKDVQKHMFRYVQGYLKLEQLFSFFPLSDTTQNFVT